MYGPLVISELSVVEQNEHHLKYIMGFKSS